MTNEKLGERENLLLRFIPQCADPSIAPANLKSSCSQYMSGPLHGVFFCAKFLLTICVRTPPWRFFCKVFAHNICLDPSMVLFFLFVHKMRPDFSILVSPPTLPPPPTSSLKICAHLKRFRILRKYFQS